MLGESRYDAECKELFERLKADGVVLIILGGDKGNGCVSSVKPEVSMMLPDLLRGLAKHMEKDLTLMKFIPMGDAN